MLNDPNNQIPGSSTNPTNNPGSSSQPPYNQMPYHPNFQTSFVNPDELSLFNQWKMQQQMGFNQYSQQQQPNQSTASQPQSDHQSFNLIDETEDENEEEPIPTSTSKMTSHGQRLKAKSKKPKMPNHKSKSRNELETCGPKTRSYIWRKVSFKFSRIQKRVVIDKKIHFGIKYSTCTIPKPRDAVLLSVLTGKWTPMNASVQKFNQLVSETLAHSEENDEDWITRVEVLYKTHVGTEFKHKSAWLFYKGKHKWTNPESTNARRNRFRVTDEKPEHFGDDALPRPPGLQRIAKSQRSGSNSTASSGSNPMMYQEFMKEQYELDRKAKMQVIEQESEERRLLIHSQKIAEDMKVLQIDTRGMDPADAAINDAQKA
ncbi:hypothetical protein Tco_1002338 [Tanacetum coccineum]|uniref:No apical meristem-associated C-terminal domain-containing protein n=1 Tax=Tanacetum coccineum TaxID=301880 RepID=A0ABQ5F6C5_9ASTR